MLSLAVIDAGDPAWQVASFLLGGGAAFLAHAGKAGARTIVNASPEPVSNVVVSTAEDVATGGLFALAVANPIAAAVIAAMLVGLSLWLALEGAPLPQANIPAAAAGRRLNPDGPGGFSLHK